MEAANEEATRCGCVTVKWSSERRRLAEQWSLLGDARHRIRPVARSRWISRPDAQDWTETRASVGL